MIDTSKGDALPAALEITLNAHFHRLSWISGMFAAFKLVLNREPLFTVDPKCCNAVIFKNPNTFPLNNLRCHCGQSWLVKWTVLNANNIEN